MRAPLPEPHGPDGAGGLVVRGGAGGVGARVDDLLAAARLLAGCARRLVEASAVVARAAADPGLLVTAPRSPTTLVRAEDALADAMTGPRGLAAAAARIAALAAALGATAAGYVAAEEGAGRAVRALDLAAGRAAGRAGLLVGVAAAPPLVEAEVFARLTGLPGPVRVLTSPEAAAAARRFAGRVAGSGDDAEHLVAAVPGVVQGLVPVASAGEVWAAAAGTDWPPRTTPDVSALLIGLAGSAGLLTDRAQVQASATPSGPVRPPGGVADLAGLVRSAYPEGGAAPGSVSVTRLDRPGGRSWVVAVPGTQVWSPKAGENPLDATSDALSMAGRASAAQAAVLEAMRSAGVRPGEPVCLVGHSLGGMVAAGAAADASSHGFTVREVVTLGSPVATYPVPKDVGVLAVEHADDLVPRLDGSANPDRAGWVTVTRRVTPDGTVPDVLATHEVGEYVRTAALVDRSTDPSVVAARARLAPFLAGPGVTATAVAVTTRRLP